ncbi:uncharacterized protein [Blastocystis hominis]|uniref:Uncharacterized protein n=1 Tax=Blastocystis hominis TaxID=12968 RepID=D8M0L3_BLAHO|nr:uncharacterized protein [Blastocystis hominis]CBK21602.2 unnamed protein product [Blastocystis hominis]|eukprot:XP_012895650.1 uncharacterized protein [Blastocystis hominis]
MIAQLHLMQSRPFGAVKFALKSIGIKPDWCEGYITLARAQREMGEVLLSLESYQKAIDLLDRAESLSEEEKEEIRRERTELVVLLDNYKTEHGELQGRAHVVENLNAVDTQFVDYSSVREIWKKEIEASEFELQERKEEESEAAKAAAANITRIDEEKFTQMEQESSVCNKQTIQIEEVYTCSLYSF